MAELPGKRLVNPEDVATSIFDWGMIKWMSEPPLTSAENMSLGYVRLAPGQGHLRHNHPESEEILFVISGEGEQMVETAREEDGGEPRYYKVRAGTLVHIPTAVYHQTVNTGTGPLDLLAIYAPHGPEAFIKSLPGTREAPPGPWPATEGVKG